MIETPMTQRFVRRRWSSLRTQMESMKPGDVLTLTRDARKKGAGNYNLALVTSRRLSDATNGARTWVVRKVRGASEFTITYHEND